jgi:hypothetical protein
MPTGVGCIRGLRFSGIVVACTLMACLAMARAAARRAPAWARPLCFSSGRSVYYHHHMCCS